MKIILKNSNLVFQKREPKNNYSWEDIVNAEGYMSLRALNKNTGDIEHNNPYSVSPAIMLEGATAIEVNGMDNTYLSKVSFFNSNSSVQTAVYHVQGGGTAQSRNGVFTIDSTVINAGIAAGADSFRVSFKTSDANGYINITRP